MKTEEKAKLLLSYYAPTLYQGVVMSDNGKVWRNSFGSKKDQATAKLNGVKLKVKLPFNIDYAMDKHLTSDNHNLAIIFPSDKNFILAYDLDSKEDELFAVIMSANTLKYTLEDMGFTSLMYLSGDKGVHVEVRFIEQIANDKLKRLCGMVQSIAESKGCQYIDRKYPSGAAYKMFGCLHYKSKNFTQIIEGNKVLSQADSWMAFESYYSVGCQGNTVAKVDHVLEQKLKAPKAEELTKKAPVKAKEAPARTSFNSTKYSIEHIEQIHVNGLYGDYTRYLMAFQLGRYFKEVLNYTEDQARSEAELWLRRHYKDQSLDYFGDDASSRISSPFHKCVKETIDNCMNGYHKGASFKPKVELKFSRKKIDKYVDGLKLSKPQTAALRYLVRTAAQYNSLIFYHSFDQLGKGFKIKDRTSIKAYIDKFIEVGAISIVMKGKYIVNGNSQATFYELTVPSNTYEITTVNMEALEIPQVQQDIQELPMLAIEGA